MDMQMLGKRCSFDREVNSPKRNPRNINYLIDETPNNNNGFDGNGNINQENKALYDTILESLETPRTNYAMDSNLKYSKTNNFFSRENNNQKNTVANVQSLILNNSYGGQQRNINKVPEQTPECNRNPSMLRSLENM